LQCASARGELFALAGRPVVGRIGTGLTVLGARPLPSGAAAGPVALLDATCALRWWFLEVGIDAYNLADARYAAIESELASDWHTRPASDTPVRHIAAGPPLRVLGTLALSY
jgi:hypothetical protein